MSSTRNVLSKVRTAAAKKVSVGYTGDVQLFKYTL